MSPEICAKSDRSPVRGSLEGGSLVTIVFRLPDNSPASTSFGLSEQPGGPGAYTPEPPGEYAWTVSVQRIR
jgi:hypothetical protein